MERLRLKRAVLAAIGSAGFGAGLVSCGGTSPYADDAFSSGPDAVYLLLDTSDSMNEAQNGVPKIESAKNAVMALIGGLGPETKIGLRSYPSIYADENCYEGSFDLTISRHDDARVDSVVSNLVAYADTPTAEALRAAGADIEAAGEPVTLVLVSDGQSTCDPPCPVAQDLDLRLDWNVIVIGFDVSGGAAGELQCIADATGGNYLTVDDGQALEDLLADPDSLFSVGD